MRGRTFFGDFSSVTFRNTKGTRCKYHLGDLKYDLGTGYGTTHCMLGGAIDGGHCDILFAYTNVRIVDKVANAITITISGVLVRDLVAVGMLVWSLQGPS